MEYRKLQEVAEVTSGNSAPQKECLYENGIYPFVRTGDVGRVHRSIHFTHPDDYLNEKGITGLRRFPKGSVLFPKSGASTLLNHRALLGEDSYVVSHLAILIPNTNRISSKYLYYATCKIDAGNLIVDRAYPSLKTSTLGQVVIPVPSTMYEQECIVAEMDLLSDIIDKQKAQLKELDKLAQSVFYDMFGDPVENERGWDVKPLGELSTRIVNGTTPKGGSEVYVNDGILFLRSQNVWRNRIDYEDIAHIDEKTDAHMKKSSLHHNDILITKTGRINTENSSLGRAALFDGKDGTANINGHVYLVRLKDGISPYFVIRILTGIAYRDYIRKVCVGGIDKRQINKEHVEKFPIIMPPLSLQESFAAKIEAIEHQKVMINQAIAETQKLFDYKIDKYFG